MSPIVEARAEDTIQYYVRIGGGDSFSSSVKGGLVDLSTGSGGGFGGDLGSSPLIDVGAGASLPNGFRADLTVANRSQFRVRGSQTDPTTGTAFAATSGDSSDWTVLANLYYDLPLDLGGLIVKPYIGAGVGLSNNSLAGVTYLANGQVLATESGVSTTNFAWAAMAGLSYQVSGPWIVDLGYRYLDAGEYRTSGVVTDTFGDTSTAVPVKAALKAHEVEFSIRYAF